jgi:hypothetical protein
MNCNVSRASLWIQTLQHPSSVRSLKQQACAASRLVRLMTNTRFRCERNLSCPQARDSVHSSVHASATPPKQRCRLWTATSCPLLIATVTPGCVESINALQKEQPRCACLWRTASGRSPSCCTPSGASRRRCRPTGACSGSPPAACRRLQDPRPLLGGLSRVGHVSAGRRADLTAGHSVEKHGVRTAHASQLLHQR